MMLDPLVLYAQSQAVCARYRLSLYMPSFAQILGLMLSKYLYYSLLHASQVHTDHAIISRYHTYVVGITAGGRMRHRKPAIRSVARVVQDIVHERV